MSDCSPPPRTNLLPFRKCSLPAESSAVRRRIEEKLGGEGGRKSTKIKCASRLVTRFISSIQPRRISLFISCNVSCAMNPSKNSEANGNVSALPRMHDICPRVTRLAFFCARATIPGERSTAKTSKPLSARSLACVPVPPPTSRIRVEGGVANLSCKILSVNRLNGRRNGSAR